MNECARLGLGTVQWGMPYGVANRSGQPTTSEVGMMLRLARQHGVSLLDTAYAYGEAERVLGEQGAGTQGFQVVTKTKPLQKGQITEEHVGDVVKAFHESLARLNVARVYGLLVHHADALLRDERVWAALENLKAKGLVEKIGVSLYEPHELDGILGKYRIDLVQLPHNIYDQRFIRSGLLDRLKSMGIEVHARSAFLQGLLLMDQDALPVHFSSIRDHHRRLHSLLREAGISSLQGCLQYCLASSQIDRLLVGCENVQQLHAITGAVSGIDHAVIAELQNFALDDEAILNPGDWPKGALLPA